AAALAVPTPPVWLAPDEACDLDLDASEDPAALAAAARAVIGAGLVDVLAQPAAERRKRLLVADLESTIIENEMLDELADFIGRRSHVAEITRRAMNGELDFAAALAERVLLLKGLPEALLDEAASRIRLTPGARALVATARANGVRTALVSGGFTVFAEPVAKELGFERVVANRLEIADRLIAGTVMAPLVTGATKRDTLLALAAECGVPRSATVAVGDGANDLAMLAAAGLGVAFHAKPTVAAAARWRVDHADLTALLYAQGYHRDEIVGV
ncbi:MAG TPA: phosphoserine phosphatase SerB, partial [Stellaceae bacterium]|nr:phosphoserine phosphatase SerB [Stellaceae bacterium]